MEKKLAIKRWHELTPDQPILPHFTPIAADAHGSTFGACGIRISGNPQFVDAVLSRLKDLLAAEAGSTRLSLSRQSVKPVNINDTVKKWNNADTDAETCYIQIRERTAKTRQRKAKESTAPLFKGDSEDIPPVTPAVLPDSFTEPTPTITPHKPPKTVKADTEDEPEPRKHFHIGGEGGEVLWD